MAKNKVRKIAGMLLEADHAAMCSLANILSIKSCKEGYQVTIGVDHEWGSKLMFSPERVAGGLILADRDRLEERARGGGS